MAHINICVEPPLKRAAVAYRPFLDCSLLAWAPRKILALSGDLAGIIEEKDLSDVTVVGFSMGGGEVALYVSCHGSARLHSIVFAAAVPPYLMKTEDNPDGPLTKEKAEEMETGLRDDRDAFFDGFTKDFFSANGDLKVSEASGKRLLHFASSPIRRQRWAA